VTDTTDTTIREAVRERYADAATRAAGGAIEEARAIEAESGCCGPTGGCGPDSSFGVALYDIEAEGAPAAALNASLGCGVPTAVADLHEGETVLDLGSGAGADVLISARRVGPAGRVIGLDMTDEMLDLARRNAAEAGVGFVDVELRETHRVHAHAGSAIVRARKPHAAE
jgi:arsenite methyltransferase